MTRTNEYAFHTHWRLSADIHTVFQILDDVEALPRWWPEVYLNVQVVEPGDAQGVGKVVQLWTRGWLPYTLRWQFTVVEKTPPSHTRLVAEGDFEGVGVWTLHQDAETADVQYDWRIRAEKPLIKHGSWLLKPIFAWNHRWAMARGFAGLQRELRRLGDIPPPPPPARGRSTR